MTQTVETAPRSGRKRYIGRAVLTMLRIIAILFLLPLATHAAWWASQNTAWNWRSANWA